MGLPNLAKLEGLDALARRDGVDTRPTLVRVLTDLYVQKSPHSAEEERHYTELVLGLLDAVDVATRAGVARKLASYPTPPAMVVRRLARDVIEVAEPILRRAELTGAELLAIIRDCGPGHAAAIAARHQPVARAPAAPEPPAPAPAETFACDLAIDLDAIFADALGPETVDPAGAAALAMSQDELAEMLFSSDAPARRALLTSLSELADARPSPVPGPPSETARKLETAALERRPGEFARVLEQALAIPPAQAHRIAEDPAGEPLLVAARALDVPSDVLLRILLFLNPAIGESVQTVFDLARLYDRLSREAAERVIAGMQTGARRARHQPLHYDDSAERSRRGAASAARRPGAPETRRQLPLRDAVFGTRQRTT